MNELSRHIGRRIRQFRKLQGLTLQQMADQLNKSKATMSKYESGDIILDVETLSAVAGLLNISMSQLTDYRPEEEILQSDREGQDADTDASSGKVSPHETSAVSNPFFQADRFYFYYYDGRYRRIREGELRVLRQRSLTADGRCMECPVALSISSDTPMGRSNQEHYTGTVLYSDMLIRVDFLHQHNPLEKNQLTLFNPSGTLCEGLLSGITTVEQVPFACKCLFSLTPQDTSLTGGLLQRLTFTRRELQLLQKRNLLLADGSQF